MSTQYIVIPMSGVICNKLDYDEIITSLHQTGILGPNYIIKSIQLYSTYNEMQTVCIMVTVDGFCGIIEADTNQVKNRKLDEWFPFKGDTYNMWITNYIYNKILNTLVLDNDHILYLGKIINEWSIKKRMIKSANKSNSV